MSSELPLVKVKQEPEPDNYNKCVVCDHTEHRTRHLDVGYHRFPSRRKRRFSYWTTFCKYAVPSLVLDESADIRLCSLHFNRSDFWDENKKRLKSGTIPSHLNPLDSEDQDNSNNTKSNKQKSSEQNGSGKRLKTDSVPSNIRSHDVKGAEDVDGATSTSCSSHAILANVNSDVGNSQASNDNTNADNKNIETTDKPVQERCDYLPTPFTFTEKMCRICLKEGFKVVPLLSEVNVDNSDPLEFVKVFQYLTGESREQVENPKVPSSMCEPCIKLMMSAYDFRKNYELSLQHLRRFLFPNVNMKIESYYDIDYQDNNDSPIYKLPQDRFRKHLFTFKTLGVSKNSVLPNTVPHTVHSTTVKENEKLIKAHGSQLLGKHIDHCYCTVSMDSSKDSMKENQGLILTSSSVEVQNDEINENTEGSLGHGVPPKSCSKDIKNYDRVPVAGSEETTHKDDKLNFVSDLQPAPKLVTSKDVDKYADVVPIIINKNIVQDSSSSGSNIESSIPQEGFVSDDKSVHNETVKVNQVQHSSQLFEERTNDLILDTEVIAHYACADSEKNSADTVHDRQKQKSTQDSQTYSTSDRHSTDVDCTESMEGVIENEEPNPVLNLQTPSPHSQTFSPGRCIEDIDQNECALSILSCKAATNENERPNFQLNLKFSSPHERHEDNENATIENKELILDQHLQTLPSLERYSEGNSTINGNEKLQTSPLEGVQENSINENNEPILEKHSESLSPLQRSNEHIMGENNKELHMAQDSQSSSIMNSKNTMEKIDESNLTSEDDCADFIEENKDSTDESHVALESQTSLRHAGDIEQYDCATSVEICDKTMDKSDLESSEYRVDEKLNFVQDLQTLKPSELHDDMNEDDSTPSLNRGEYILDENKKPNEDSDQQCDTRLPIISDKDIITENKGAQYLQTSIQSERCSEGTNQHLHSAEFLKSSEDTVDKLLLAQDLQTLKQSQLHVKGVNQDNSVDSVDEIEELSQHVYTVPLKGDEGTVEKTTVSFAQDVQTLPPTERLSEDTHYQSSVPVKTNDGRVSDSDKLHLVKYPQSSPSHEDHINENMEILVSDTKLTVDSGMSIKLNMVNIEHIDCNYVKEYEDDSNLSSDSKTTAPPSFYSKTQRHYNSVVPLENSQDPLDDNRELNLSQDLETWLPPNLHAKNIEHGSVTSIQSGENTLETYQELNSSQHSETSPPECLSLGINYCDSEVFTQEDGDKVEGTEEVSLKDQSRSFENCDSLISQFARLFSGNCEKLTTGPLANENVSPMESSGLMMETHKPKLTQDFKSQLVECHSKNSEPTICENIARRTKEVDARKESRNLQTSVQLFIDQSTDVHDSAISCVTSNISAKESKEVNLSQHPHTLPTVNNKTIDNDDSDTKNENNEPNFIHGLNNQNWKHLAYDVPIDNSAYTVTNSKPNLVQHLHTAPPINADTIKKYIIKTVEEIKELNLGDLRTSVLSDCKISMKGKEDEKEVNDNNIMSEDLQSASWPRHFSDVGEDSASKQSTILEASESVNNDYDEVGKNYELNLSQDSQISPLAESHSKNEEAHDSEILMTSKANDQLLLNHDTPTPSFNSSLPSILERFLKSPVDNKEVNQKQEVNVAQDSKKLPSPQSHKPESEQFEVSMNSSEDTADSDISLSSKRRSKRIENAASKKSKLPNNDDLLPEKMTEGNKKPLLNRSLPSLKPIQQIKSKGGKAKGRVSLKKSENPKVENIVLDLTEEVDDLNKGCEVLDLTDDVEIIEKENVVLDLTQDVEDADHDVFDLTQDVEDIEDERESPFPMSPISSPSSQMQVSDSEENDLQTLASRLQRKNIEIYYCEVPAEEAEAHLPQTLLQPDGCDSVGENKELSQTSVLDSGNLVLKDTINRTEEGNETQGSDILDPPKTDSKVLTEHDLPEQSTIDEADCAVSKKRTISEANSNQKDAVEANEELNESHDSETSPPSKRRRKVVERYGCVVPVDSILAELEDRTIVSKKDQLNLTKESQSPAPIKLQRNISERNTKVSKHKTATPDETTRFSEEETTHKELLSLHWAFDLKSSLPHKRPRKNVERYGSLVSVDNFVTKRLSHGAQANKSKKTAKSVAREPKKSPNLPREPEIPQDVVTTNNDRTIPTTNTDNEQEISSNFAIKLHRCPFFTCNEEFSALELRKHCRVHHSYLDSYFKLAPQFKNNIRFFANRTKNKGPWHEEVVFTCRFCNDSFNGATFKDHANAHNDRQDFRCNVCNRTFMKIHFLKNHELCHKKETSENNKSRHEKSNTASSSKIDSAEQSEEPGEKNLKYKCLVCQTGFAEYHAFKKHRSEHKSGVPYSTYQNKQAKQKLRRCSDCGQLLKLGESASLHTCKFTCAKCHEIFTKTEFNRHTCSGKSAAQGCMDCGNTFSLPSSLKAHTCTADKSSTEDVNELCPICGVESVGAVAVWNHKQVHALNKMYACARCNQSFTAASSLKDHVMTTHDTQSIYQCKLCSQTFTSKWKYDEHSRIHRLPSDTNRCHICGENFATTRNLLRHLEKIHAERINVGKSKNGLQSAAEEVSNIQNDSGANKTEQKCSAGISSSVADDNAVIVID